MTMTSRMASVSPLKTGLVRKIHKVQSIVRNLISEKVSVFIIAFFDLPKITLNGELQM